MRLRRFQPQAALTASRFGAEAVAAHEPYSPSDVSIGTATLELADLPLHQQILQFAARAGCRTVKIVPLFLLPGVHVMQDIPAEIALAQQANDRLAIEQCPYLGSHPRLRQLLSADPIAAEAPRILLSHGSRRAGGNAPVETIAAEIGAAPAYWSVSPSLETQVTALVKLGCPQIVILPYFLFAGGITDAIAETVSDLARQFPYVRLHLAEPLGASAAMADLIVDLIAPSHL